MSNHRPQDQVLVKPVACWLTNKDYDRLMSISKKYDVKVAVFIRSVIVDALADEDERAEKVPTIKVHTPKQENNTFTNVHVSAP